uniref:NHL repeat containing protein n=1 Tax=Adineta vaga TaxID=104782 RepID=B3G3Y6_ADIVA|nr:NHL repeat containing protein [Adineta vaga]
MAKFSYNNQSLVHDSTPDDLSLKERYSNVTRSESINLQVKDETQPVDVSIHHETKKIYLCDVGRSVVEIYDMNKTFEHIINNSTMIKFRPTAIAITTNGTVIVASHFGHCLHMYSPNDSQNGTNSYSYKQFKLGTEGNQIHQFFQPAGIATDRSDGYLYVCDRGNCRIQVFTPDGICERIIELFLNYKKKYQLDPIRIAIQKNSDQLVCIVGAGDAICFVPKRTNGRIYVNPFFISDENELGLDNAAGLAVDDQDRIFISDTGHHRIVICTSDGNYITSFGTEGDGIGQLKRPCGLDITNDGTVIVTDPGNKRLQLFGVIQNKSSNEKSDDRSNLLINAEDISLTSL